MFSTPQSKKVANCEWSSTDMAFLGLILIAETDNRYFQNC